VAESAIDEDALPPYIDAENLDVNVKADVNTLATVLSVVTSLVFLAAYLEAK